MLVVVVVCVIVVDCVCGPISAVNNQLNAVGLLSWLGRSGGHVVADMLYVIVYDF